MTTMSPRTGKIFSISLAHLINDWYMNYIQTLLPFLVAAGLGVGKGAFLISAFTITSSLLQPVFGYLVDQKNQRWMVYLGTLWMAGLVSLAGVVKYYPLQLVLVTLAGMGTAAFHPQASAMISAVSGHRKGFFQALFVAAGNVGWALTPLMTVPFVLHFGLGMSPAFFLLGLGAALMLWLTAPRLETNPRAAPPPFWSAIGHVWADLVKVVLVVACRSLAYFGLVAFLPLYLQHANVSPLTSSRLLFLMLFAGALGGMAGGYLSDSVGRKPVIVGSLALATPVFYLYLHSTGVAAYILLALAGACLLASFSVTVVVAQELISKNAAVASGLVLGFGVGTGGLGVGLMGLLAQRWGMDLVIDLLITLPLLAGLLGLFIRDRAGTPAPRQQLQLTNKN